MIASRSTVIPRLIERPRSLRDSAGNSRDGTEVHGPCALPQPDHCTSLRLS